MRSETLPSHLIVHSTEPLNAEPPLARLCASFLTPEADFYIRSHGPFPALDAAAHRITVSGGVRTPRTFSLADLQARFPAREVTAVLQCAGNRRADMVPVKPVLGDPWAPGAIGNGVWTGVPLCSVLQACGLEQDQARHAAFACADSCVMDGVRFDYGVSIPIAKAMTEDVLLAWALNGAPLTLAHGAPLRVIVPGYAGARSAKWLTGIRIQPAPADGPMQRLDYKLFPSACSKENADPENGVTINAMPLNSAICTPARHATLESGRVRMAGYATAAPHAIVRVEVSADEGGHWRQAALRQDKAAPWSWTLWEAELSLPPGRHVLAVRAWDESGQTQPSRVEEVWNFKGYLCNAWHRVPVHVA